MERQAALEESQGENAALTERIREIHHRSRETYGYPRVHAELLRAVGIHCNRKRVARLMRKDGLRGSACEGVGESTPPARTLSSHPRPGPLGQELLCPRTQSAVDSRDITYLPTDEGFVYLAFILDFSTPGRWGRLVYGQPSAQ